MFWNTATTSHNSLSNDLATPCVVRNMGISDIAADIMIDLLRARRTPEKSCLK